jgi:hypothetical protein
MPAMGLALLVRRLAGEVHQARHDRKSLRRRILLSAQQRREHCGHNNTAD